MARKKKLFNYEFTDCKQTFPSSVTVKCSKTGESVKMYHRQLVKLVESKYRNNWSLFKASYIKKGNRSDPDVDDIDENINRPEGYRKYLILAYMGAKRDKSLSPSELAAKLDFLNKCYYKRWNEDLEQVIKDNC